MSHGTLTALLPALRIRLPGIPEPVLQDAIVRVARQFYWETESWKHTVPTLLDWVTTQPFPTLTAGAEIPGQTVMKRIDTVKYGVGGTSLAMIDFKTRDQLDRETSDWEIRTGSSPDAWTYDNQEPIIVPIATANQTGSLKIRVVVAPEITTLASNVIPDLLFHEHEEFLKWGVWAQLMDEIGKDWSNPQQAMKYTIMYDAGIKKAKSRSEAEFGQPKDTMAYGGL